MVTSPDALLHAAIELDERVYRVVAGTSTPALDRPLRTLSSAANWSRLSFAAAGVLALVGGSRGRRAASYGLGCVAVASVVANLGGKLATRRERPDRDALGVAPDRYVPMPSSSSFPSGHSASAFAFATGVRHAWPTASVPCYALAAAVALSRVYTGVHYPGDVVAGGLLGLGSGALTTRALDRVPPLQPGWTRRSRDAIHDHRSAPAATPGLSTGTASTSARHHPLACVTRWCGPAKNLVRRAQQQGGLPHGPVDIRLGVHLRIGCGDVERHLSGPVGGASIDVVLP